MDWNQAKDAIALGLIGTCIAIAGWIANLFLEEARKLRASVEALNLNVAVILQRMESHETRMDHHEVRITKLEDRVS